MQKQALTECVNRIREKTDLDKPVLSNSDYDYLAFLIEEKTNVRLSRSTLRRLWENIYDKFPRPSTLDALAQFLDFENWNSYKKTFIEKEQFKNGNSSRRLNWKYLLLILIPVIVGFAVKKSTIINKSTADSDIIFNYESVGNTGVPKRVIFEYNVDKYEADSFFIKTTWRNKDIQEIHKKSYFKTAVYQKSGQFMAKLIADTNIVKEILVVVETDGWMGYFRQNPRMMDLIHLDRDEIIESGKMSTDDKSTKKYGISSEKNYHLYFNLVKEFSDIDFNNCIIETSFRMKQSYSPCPKIKFEMETKGWINNHILLMPNDCMSGVPFSFGERKVYGVGRDLTKFGCNIFERQEIEIKIENQFININRNNEQILQYYYVKTQDKLLKLSYVFNGIGEVDYFRIKSLDGKVLYEDEFEKPLVIE